MRRLSKIALVIAGVLVVAAGAAGFRLAAPLAIDIAVDDACPAPFTASCLDRVRGRGHYWSAAADFARAERWYRRGVQAGDRIAMFHMGWLEEARGAAASLMPAAARNHFRAAAEWYWRSAELGFAPAMNNLGEAFAEGRGIRQDFAEAHRWHVVAGRAGNPVAAINLAADFAAGGMAADPGLARRWQTIDPARAAAADLESPTLERTLLHGQPVPDETLRQMRVAEESGEPFTLPSRALAADARAVRGGAADLIQRR